MGFPGGPVVKTCFLDWETEIPHAVVAKLKKKKEAGQRVMLDRNVSMGEEIVSK